MLQSRLHYKILPAFVLAFLGLCLVPPAAWAALPSLPVLNWQQRSDWVNVKTSVAHGAVGDGVHDDTAALQAGLNLLDHGCFGRKTLYLPAGTYRITKTLTFGNVYGALIIGNGRTTRIVWDGPRGQVMYWSNGASRSRFVGIIWDGANRASIGIDHHPRTNYETGIRHQDEAFLNFLVAGVRVGYQQTVPTSEMTYKNCLFKGCASGVVFLCWNDYNNNFEGCEFQDNGTAINCLEGNVYVSDCHFERSRTTDMLLCSECHSVRRCTSVGSKQFINVPGSGSPCLVTAESCLVDGWTGNQGAMTFGMRGPNTIFDCSFTHPPDAKAPVRLTNYGGFPQILVVSNNSAPASTSVADLGQNGVLSTLPSGARGASLTDPTRSFFKSSEAVPSATLDVKTSFGAKGDGYADDTLAITSALNAARAQGGNAVVYFPEGIYRVSATLPLSGGNYTVEGSGFDTVINWAGPPNSVVFSVQGPQGLALKDMRITAPLDTACIQQIDAGAVSSRMTYEQIDVGGSFVGPINISGAPANRGLECIALGPSSIVQLDDFYGSTHFTDCSRATILGDFVSGGVLRVDGAHFAKTGFLGLVAHNDGGTPCDVVVSDNQDLVGTNFYTESTQSALRVSGDGALTGQAGHVTIGGARVQTWSSTSTVVDDYEGRVTYAGGGLESPLPSITQTGDRPVDIVLLADVFNGGDINFVTDSGAKITSVGNYAFDYTNASNIICTVSTNRLPSLTPAGVTSALSGGLTPQALVSQAPLAPAVAALDDFRLLGEYDLALNYP